MGAMTEADLGRLMQSSGDALLRMAFLYLRDASLAKDAVQDTFLKAYRHYDKFRGDCDEMSWLSRILINTCKDMNRTAWARFVDRRKALDELPEPSAPFEEKDDTVLGAVMRLRPRDKEVVLLKYYQGMTTAQIAQTLGISESTVSSRLLRAKQRLKDKLEGWYFDAE